MKRYSTNKVSRFGIKSPHYLNRTVGFRGGVRF